MPQSHRPATPMRQQTPLMYNTLVVFLCGLILGWLLCRGGIG